MPGTTIGEVNISLRMNLTQFKKDTQDGTAAADKAAKQLGSSMSAGTSEARGSLMLLSEEIGVHMPRHLQAFISQLPGVATALNAAFSSVAVLALLEVVVKVVEKIKEYSEMADKAAEEQRKFNEQMEAFGRPSDKAIDDITKIEDTLDKTLTGMANQSQINNWIGGAFKSIGDAVDKDLPLLSDFLEVFHKGDAKAQAFATSVKFFVERVKDIEKTDGAKAALAAIADELRSLSEGGDRARTDVQDTIKALEAMQRTLSNKVNDEFQKGVEDAAKAAQKAIDAEWESYQRMLKIAKQSSIYKVTDNHQTVEDMRRTGAYTSIAPNAGAAGQHAPTDLGAGIETKPEYVGVNPELVKIQNDQKAAMEEAKKAYEETRTSAEKYADTISQLNELLKQGKIDQETYDRAVRLAQDAEDKSSKLYQKLGADIGKTVEQAALFGRSWTDALKAVAIQITELILQMTLFKGMTENTSKGGGGFFSNLLSGFAGAGFGGGMADGGPLESGKWYVAGEHGPEPIWGGGPGAFAAGYGHDGPGVSNHFEMHVHGVTDADSFKQSSSQIMGDALQMMAAAHKRTRS